MSDAGDDNTGLLAAIMGFGIFAGLVGYAIAAFYFGIPGFESAPAMMGCWLAALIIVTVLARRRKPE